MNGIIDLSDIFTMHSRLEMQSDQLKKLLKYVGDDGFGQRSEKGVIRDIRSLVDLCIRRMVVSKNLTYNEEILGLTDEINSTLEKAESVVTEINNLQSPTNSANIGNTLKRLIPEVMGSYNNIGHAIKEYEQRFQWILSDVKQFEEDESLVLEWVAEILNAREQLETDVDELVRTSRATADLAKTLDIFKRKIELDASNSNKLAKTEMIEHWKTPTLYQILFTMGLGILTGTSLFTVFLDLPVQIMPYSFSAGGILLAIGLRGVHRHDMAKLHAYSEATGIDVVTLLKKSRYRLPHIFTSRKSRGITSNDHHDSQSQEPPRQPPF